VTHEHSRAYARLLSVGRGVTLSGSARSRRAGGATSRPWCVADWCFRDCPLRRTQALTGERFDVVVIGGGITDAGVALDAVPSGVDFACALSRGSSERRPAARAA
jgi:hypothetical protein